MLALPQSSCRTIIKLLFWVRGTQPSSVSLGLTKEIASFDSTQIAKCQLYQGNLSTFGEPLRFGLIKLMSPIRVEQS